MYPYLLLSNTQWFSKCDLCHLQEKYLFRMQISEPYHKRNTSVCIAASFSGQYRRNTRGGPCADLRSSLCATCPSLQFCPENCNCLPRLCYLNSGRLLAFAWDPLAVQNGNSHQAVRRVNQGSHLQSLLSEITVLPSTQHLKISVSQLLSRFSVVSSRRVSPVCHSILARVGSMSLWFVTALSSLSASHTLLDSLRSLLHFTVLPSLSCSGLKGSNSYKDLDGNSKQSQSF